jgi:hypothetical protein
MMRPFGSEISSFTYPFDKTHTSTATPSGNIVDRIIIARASRDVPAACAKASQRAGCDANVSVNAHCVESDRAVTLAIKTIKIPRAVVHQYAIALNDD